MLSQRDFHLPKLNFIVIIGQVEWRLSIVWPHTHEVGGFRHNTRLRRARQTPRIFRYFGTSMWPALAMRFNQGDRMTPSRGKCNTPA